MEYRNIFESQLIYLGTFGLDDPVRKGIREEINILQYGDKNADQSAQDKKETVVVKMVSGDHLETAKAIAIEAGIIDEKEALLDDIAMTGDQFREKLGQYDIYTDENNMESIRFQKKSTFNTINKRVRVIARATPIDKFLMIRGV